MPPQIDTTTGEVKLPIKRKGNQAQSLDLKDLHICNLNMHTHCNNNLHVKEVSGVPEVKKLTEFK